MKIKFHSPLDGLNFQYCMCRKEKHFRAMLKHLNFSGMIEEWVHEGADATVHNLISESHETTILCIKPGDIMGTLGLLVHESTHIFDDMVKCMNERNPSSEFKAYSMQSIFQTLASELYGKISISK